MYKIDKNDTLQTWSDKKLNSAEVGATFRVPVPDVDKGHSDDLNVLVAVVGVNIKYYKVIKSLIYFIIIILILFQFTVYISQLLSIIVQGLEKSF